MKIAAGSRIADRTASGSAANDGGVPWRMRTVDGRTIRLDLQFADGNRRALPYAYLTDIRYNLSTGIVLLYPSLEVAIRGRHLGELYEGLLFDRVEWLREEGKELDTKTESEPFIAEVAVKTR